MPIELLKDFSDEAELTRFSEEISDFVVSRLEAGHDFSHNGFGEGDEKAVLEAIARYDSLNDEKLREIMRGVIDTLEHYAFHAGKAEPELDSIQPSLYALAEKVCNRVSSGRLSEIFSALRKKPERQLHR
ncbi:MAG: hypothetical protein WC602_01255 [archaeon]